MVQASGHRRSRVAGGRLALAADDADGRQRRRACVWMKRRRLLTRPGIDTWHAVLLELPNVELQVRSEVIRRQKTAAPDPDSSRLTPLSAYTAELDKGAHSVPSVFSRSSRRSSISSAAGDSAVPFERCPPVSARTAREPHSSTCSHTPQLQLIGSGVSGGRGENVTIHCKLLK
jgi:hypothetical protein